MEDIPWRHEKEVFHVVVFETYLLLIGPELKATGLLIASSFIVVLYSNK